MFAKFIEENIERDIKSFETTDVLYERYLDFCSSKNMQPMQRRAFAFELRNSYVGAKYSHKGKAARWGVKLLPCKY